MPENDRIKRDNTTGYPVLLAQPSPPATGSARSVAREGVRLADGRVLVLPAGITEDELRVALSDHPEDRRPADDGRPTWDEQQQRYVLPMADTGADTTTRTEEVHMSDTSNLTPLREATRRCRNVVGNLEIIKVDGRNYVRTADLERLVGRGNSGGGQGAGERIAGAIDRGQKQRSQAFAARRRREASDAGRRRSGR